MGVDVEDDFSKEIISGHAGKVEDVEQLVNRFREATQTLGLFGGRRVVWLKGCTFLADNQTGRAEGTQQACEDLREILETVVPEKIGSEMFFVISLVSPVRADSSTCFCLD